MKRLHLLMFFVLLFSIPAFSQDDITISYFQGGSYRIRFSFASALFSGVGLRSEGMAGTLSGLANDPAMVVRHPAALATWHGPMAVLDITPPIQLNPASLIDLDASIRSSVNENLANYHVPQQAITYPSLDIRFGQTGVTGSGAAVVPTPYGFLGFALYHPLSLSLNVVGGGFSTMIETSKAIGDKVTVVQFATQMNPSIQFQLQTTAASLSYGAGLSRKLAVGFTLDWLTAKLTSNAYFKLDGIMLLRQQGAAAGQEYAFNDPYDESIRQEDGEQNTLDQWAIGSYEGSGWGAKFSLLYLANPRWSVDLAVSLPPKLNMPGQMSFVQNLIPALTAENLLSDDPNAELFDVTKLNLAKPTLTRRLVNPTDSLLVLRFPISFTIGTSKRLGARTMLALNYSRYFGEFAYDYLQYHQGLKFKQGLRFGATFPFAWFLSPETILLRLLGQRPRPTFRLGFGVIFADEVKSGFKYQKTNAQKYQKTGILLPSFAMGKSFWLIRRVQTDVLLAALPASILKISFLYRF
ncbi:MAG: hypothetical protein D6814_03370 [Calditrichaeota bacterium]|nr:MAG: hypothetical protein D6814_03370 [Calditrichota bacterium]